MKCQKCGADIPDNSKVCLHCVNEQENWQELVQSAVEGEQNAIAELYNSTYNAVYRTIKSMIRDEDTALDILQDSYVKGFQNLNQLQNPSQFRAWMKQIATNTSKNWLKKKKPVLFSELENEDGEMTVEFVDERTESLPDAVMDQKETSRLINEILDSLPEDQRLVVGMFYYENMSVKEIAEVLGCSENTVKSRLNYARKKIRASVEDLEKKGTKLHSLAPIPFLLWLFKGLDAQAAESPSSAVLQGIRAKMASGAAAATTLSSTAGTIASAVKSAASSTTNGTLAGTVTPAASSTAETIASTVTSSATSPTVARTAADTVKSVASSTTVGTVANAAKAGVGVASKGIAKKIIAGVVAAVILVGGTVGAVVTHNNNHTSGDTSPYASTSETETENKFVIDPFDESFFGFGENKSYRLSFSDISPYIWFNIEKNIASDVFDPDPDPISEIEYEADKYKNLKIGDVITVTAKLSQKLVDLGYTLSRAETTVIVENVDAYVDDPSQIPDSVLQSMFDFAYQTYIDEASVDFIDAEGTNWTPWGSDFENYRIGKVYFMLNKNGDYRDNVLVVTVYKDIVSEDHRWNNVVRGFGFSNIIIHPDGTLSYDHSGFYPGMYEGDEIFNERQIDPLRSDYDFFELQLP